MTINGSGTITGLSAGGLPDAIIQQADLAANVAGNGPAFSAYQSSLQSIPSGTFTKIVFDTEEFDTNSNYNNTGSTVGSNPSYSFLPTVAGYYQVTAICWFSGGLAVQPATSIYKNGAEFKRGISVGQGVAAYGPFVSALVYMNGTTDYIGAYVAQFYASAQNTIPGAVYTYFQASMVRSA
jgi:hypothetical protein